MGINLFIKTQLITIFKFPTPLGVSRSLGGVKRVIAEQVGVCFYFYTKISPADHQYKNYKDKRLGRAFNQLLQGKLKKCFYVMEVKFQTHHLTLQLQEKGVFQYLG